MPAWGACTLLVLAACGYNYGIDDSISSDDVAGSLPAIKPCSAAMGILGTPAVRWNTKADLFGQLERARLYLDSASLDEATVKSAAQEAGLSLHHFIRLFHERYGRSPLEYLCERRKRTAADLLGSTELSVSEIALEVGFESPSAFGRWFKREFHMTPSRYRAQLV